MGRILQFPAPPARGGYYSGIVDQYGAPIPRPSATAYEAAGQGRRLATWDASSGGPNSITQYALSTMRRRARQLVRNNPHGEAAVEEWASDLIGTGIMPRWSNIQDEALREAVQLLWSDWTDEADSDDATDFYGLQTLIAKAVVESGECFVRFRQRRPEDGLSVPLQLQVLEADFLDESYESIFGGNVVRMGIEFGAFGQRVAYWMFRNHPGENSFFLNTVGLDRVRVPASEICHIRALKRPGQLRGVPWLASIIVRLHELDQYEDAELVRKKGAAMFGGFIEEAAQESMDNPFIGRRGENDSSGSPVVELEPGTFPVLPPGSSVKFSNPVDVGETYQVWIVQQLRAIAKGLGITYEQLTGDLSQVNYSSIRAGLLQFRRRCEALQWHMLIFQLCRPVLWRWLELAVLSDAIQLPGYYRNRRLYRRVEWKTPGWDWVDPESEINAAIKAVRAGLTSRSAIISARGEVPELVDRQIAADRERAKKYGLVLESDFEAVQGQQSEPGGSQEQDRKARDERRDKKYGGEKSPRKSGGKE